MKNLSLDTGTRMFYISCYTRPKIDGRVVYNLIEAISP